MARQKKTVEEIKEGITKRKPAEKVDFKAGLSTGSTLLNLACTGRTNVGFLPGCFYFFVGDSSSGKTFTTLTCFAEACQNPLYENYRLIFDNAEGGALMDIEKFFGKRVAERMEPPSVVGLMPRYSETIEEFYYHLDSATEGETPCIYVLDSMDVLGSDSSNKKFDQHKKAHARKMKKAAGEDAGAKEEELKGSMGDGKAKINSSSLRSIIPNLKRNGSILIIINQTRDAFGFGAQFEPKTRSGGHALTFYATLEVWTSIGMRITKTIKGKSRKMGIKCKARVKKNRITGKDSTVLIPILYKSGFDDTGSMVDYLVDEGHWAVTGKAGKGTIDATEFGVKGSDEKVIQEIERQGKEKELRMIVSTVWNDVDEASTLPRKKRYS